MSFSEKGRCCSASCFQDSRDPLSGCLWKKQQHGALQESIFLFSVPFHRSDKCLAIKIHLSCWEHGSSFLHNVSRASTHTHETTKILRPPYRTGRPTSSSCHHNSSALVNKWKPPLFAGFAVYRRSLCLVFTLPVIEHRVTNGVSSASEHCDVDQYHISGDAMTVVLFNLELHIL